MSTTLTNPALNSTSASRMSFVLLCILIRSRLRYIGRYGTRRPRLSRLTPWVVFFSPKRRTHAACYYACTSIFLFLVSTCIEQGTAWSGTRGSRSRCENRNGEVLYPGDGDPARMIDISSRYLSLLEPITHILTYCISSFVSPSECA